MRPSSVAVTAFCTALALLASLAISPAEASGKWLRVEGLYYLDGTPGDRDSDIAFVITRDGSAIPPKSNDRGAPTLQGLHVGDTRYRFAKRSVNTARIAFRTVTVRGVSYRFDGRVGFEQVETIEDVPYVVGTLYTTRHGKTSKRKARFVHAVVL